VSVRVIIMDPNGFPRLLLREALVEAGFEVVGECSTPARVLAAAASGGADVLITNVLMPESDTDGYALTAQIRAEHPELKVLILTAYDGGDHVAQARAAGASGFLSKRVGTDAIAEAVTAIAAGGTWFGEAERER
jgi:DNA-binding NarL/FixJ family response regulator